MRVACDHQRSLLEVQRRFAACKVLLPVRAYVKGVGELQPS